MKVNELSDGTKLGAPVPAWWEPAWSVIRDADPATYRRMVAADWSIILVRSGVELIPAMNALKEKFGAFYAFEQVKEMAKALDSAYGITDDDSRPSLAGDLLTHTTWLNVPDIEAAAKKEGMDLPKWAANVLVHEFQHRAGLHSETAAFRESLKFSRLLGDPKIDAMNRETGEGEAKRELFEALIMGR